jgi:hypothetical protein
MDIGKSFNRGLIILSAVMLGSTLATADVVTFGSSCTSPASICGVESTLDASAEFTTGAGTVSIDLTNLLNRSQMHDAGQLVTDVSFTLSNVSTGTSSISSSSTNYIIVASGGTFSSDGSGNLDWSLTPTGSGTEMFTLTFPGPDQGIIGNGGSGNYTDANPSIAGNGPHNPFAQGSADWILDIPGVTSTTNVTAASISFGTESQITIPGTPTTVPEPSSLLFLGAAMLGLAVYGKRVSVN